MSSLFDTSTDPPSWIFNVLEFCSWKERVAMLDLSRNWRNSEAFAGSSAYFWRWCCERLTQENFVYIPLEDVQLSHGGWRAEFLERWPQRNTWTRGERHSAQEAIKVAVRFREPAQQPVSSGNDEKEVEDASRDCAEPIVLPLHQRLQLIKMTAGVKSTSEAMRILMGAHGKRDPFDAYLEEAKLEVDAPERLRECDEEEQDHEKENANANEAASASHLEVIQSSYKASVLSIDESDSKVLVVAPGVGLRQFEFDQVYQPAAPQPTVYGRSARRIVGDFINGYNGSIIVYGQTGSGKTYTMFGEPEAPGVVPRACAEIFQVLEDRRRLGIEYEIAVSYVEVFGQEVIDLLRDGQAVGQSRVAGQRYVIDGRARVAVSNLREVDQLLQRGHEMKRRAATAMNERSSRAHALFILHLNQVWEDRELSIPSTLILADLGGSEKVKKSEVNSMLVAAGFHSWQVYYDSRRRLQEALNINAGLLALKKCISALNAQREAQDGGANIHIPYHDSKLTTLLSASLGGDSKTLVLVTASLDQQHSIETVQSLRFGEDCANIETSTTASVSALSSIILKLDAEIKEMEAQIALKERWETRKVVRKDMEGDEVMTVTIPVGAEPERARLEELLNTRRELFGTA